MNFRNIIILSQLFFIFLCFVQQNAIYAQYCGTPTKAQSFIAEPSSDYETAYIASKDILKAELRTPYEIPMIIHLVHSAGTSPGTGSVPAIADIEDGIDILNAVFSGETSCGISAPGPDIQISFCPAQRTVHGLPTEGILPFESSYAHLDMCTEEKTMKEKIQRIQSGFPTTDYLNIYIVENICASCSEYDCDVRGFASYSTAHGTAHDGIVIEYTAWPGIDADCNLAKTLYHELGHYFNLYHTFYGACKNDDCLRDGDKVCDTPPDRATNISPNNPCTSGESYNSCTTDADATNPENPFISDVPDLQENFMDYAPPSCIQSFTEGQKERMLFTLENERASLLQFRGCQSGCDPYIALSAEDIPSQIPVESPISIINTSDPAYTYHWILPDGAIEMTYSLNYTSDELGYQTIGLTSPDMSIDCRDTLWLSFEVTCPLSGTIQGPQGKLTYGQTYQWSVAPQPGVTFRWYLDEEFLDEGLSISFPIEFKGIAGLKLQACNIECCDIVDVVWLRTTDCPSGHEADYWIFNDTRGSELGHPLSIRFAENEIIYDTITETNYGPRPYDNYDGYEGCLSVNDREGNLLFYSDGRTLFNRNHENMASYQSHSVIYQANRSTTQMAYCKKPGSDSLYYIFTTEEIRHRPAEDANSYLRAAIVDMSRDDGLGMLIEDDIQIFKPSSEKIQVVPHCNGRDYWVVTTEGLTNKIVSFLVDTTGIQLNPIKSDVLSPYFALSNEQFEFNIFSDGFTLNSIRGVRSSLPPFETDQFMEFGIFDNHTGIHQSIDTLFKKAFNYLSFGSSSSAQSPDGRYAYFDMGLYTFVLDIEALLYKKTIKIDTFFEINGRAVDFSRTPHGEIVYMYSSFDPEIYGLIRIRRILYPNRPFPASLFQDTSDTKKMDIGDYTLQFPQFNHDVYEPEKPFIQGMRMYCDTLETVSYTVKNNCSSILYEWKIVGNSEILYTDEDSIALRPMGGIDTLIYVQETACGQQSDTMIITAAVCTESCNNQFDWVEPDTVLCGSEEEVFLKFSSNAVFSYLYTDAEKSPLTVSNGIITGPAPWSIHNTTTSRRDRQVFWLHLETEMGCDTLIEFYITRDTSLNMDDIRAETMIDTSVCLGENAELQLPSSPPYIFLEKNETGQLRELSEDIFTIESIQADSCFTLYFFNQDSTCSFDTSFCISPLDVILYDRGEEILCASDTLIWQGNTITEAGIYQDTVSCDSIYEIEVFYREAIPETILRDTSCSFTVEAIDTSILQSVDGCDSLVISYQYPQAADSIFLDLVTCDSTLLGMDTIFRNHVMDCDSVIFRSYTYDDIITESISLDTCVLHGTSVENDTLHLLSSAGCDSLVYISYELRYPVTTRISESSCMTQVADTVFLMSEYGCDSLVITDYILSPSDTIYLEESRCEEIASDTIILRNQFDCDSLVITTYALVDADTTYLSETSCEPRASDTVSYTNTLECDSLVITEYLVEDGFVTLPESIHIKVGDTVRLIPDYNFTPVSYSWSQQDGFIPGTDLLSPTLLLEDSGTYCITLNDAAGCSYTACTYIEVIIPSDDVYIPNAFSPNGDGINDIFKIYSAEEAPIFQKMEIYDRWGARIYSSAGPEVSWNGLSGQEAMNPGVYVYKIVLDYSNGDEKVFSGDVMVLK